MRGCYINREILNLWRIGMRPVSYTHLDVYKRQGWTSQRAFCLFAGLQPGAGPGKDGAGTGPVSYTHLDVYKRQPEDLPRIFEKGYTGYNGRSDKKASGIGLYLCRRICQNLGHSITANSSLDSGTVIRIRLDQKKLEIE